MASPDVSGRPDRLVKVPRWRINDNLPGTRYFCPTVVRTDAVGQAIALNVPQLFQSLTAEFGEDLLRRDGAVPEPIILPVSAAITDDPGERRSYDRVLDEISKPLMQEAREYITFTPTQTTYPDGVVSNFVFHSIEQAQPVWRYP